MTATVLKMRVATASLRCSECGAPGKAGCNCGVAYIPAAEFAAKALKANPEKSDRAIADEIGVDHKTVAKARKQTGESSPVAKRTGKDGKARRMPVRNLDHITNIGTACDLDPENPADVAEEGDTPAVIWARIFEYRSTESVRFAKDSLADIGKAEVNSQMIKACAAVVAAWTKLHDNLKRRNQ